MCVMFTGGNTALSRKAGGSKGKRYGAGPATTDEALLSRLGEILGGNMKEDFMVVHLQEPCSFCRTHVNGGILHKWVAALMAALGTLCDFVCEADSVGYRRRHFCAYLPEMCAKQHDQVGMVLVWLLCPFSHVPSLHPLPLLAASASVCVVYRYMGGAAGTSALSRPPPERRFEGIRLESPGPAAPTGPLAHLQICQGCYSTEMTRVSSGAKGRLPGSLVLTDLTQQVCGVVCWIEGAWRTHAGDASMFHIDLHCVFLQRRSTWVG